MVEAKFSGDNDEKLFRYNLRKNACWWSYLLENEEDKSIVNSPVASSRDFKFTFLVPTLQRTQ